jgi:hypothetical protein
MRSIACLPRTILLAIAALVPCAAAGHGLSGALIGTVRDEQGGTVAGAYVTIRSSALIGGPASLVTSEQGQLRFADLPPGIYTLVVQMPGLVTWRDEHIAIGAAATIERHIVLRVAGVAESVVIEGAGPRLDTRNPGLATTFGVDDLRAIPTRRSSMFDWIRAAPGISPTSPSSGTVTTVSAFGSGTNENQFLFDGTNFTCPCRGLARSEPGIDFIQEVHVQTVGASAEYGNVQGAVINVITRQGGDRFRQEAAYYGQTAALTSRPVALAYPGSGPRASSYERARFHDVTTSLGGPVRRDRLWFFAGYQFLRDEDSQPGTDPAFPRTYAQDKMFAKLTWRLTPALRLEQSIHYETGLNPERPTIVTPFEATARRHISVPATTFGHLTHTVSPTTLWDVRVGRFVYSQEDEPLRPGVASRFDRLTGVATGAPPRLGSATIFRTTVKSTVSHYRADVLGADHQFKAGGQFERGGHLAIGTIPTGVRFVDNAGAPFQAVASDASSVGGMAVTASAFASDAITVSDRLTITAGLRFDRSRASSQDLHAVDAQGRETDAVVPGLGTLYTWNILSPRLGATMQLSADGRTVLRASYGRFSQGVLTGELEFFHPGATPTTTTAFVEATGNYSRLVSRVDPRVNLQLDRETRTPHTDEYSVGVDREVAPHLALALAYVHKTGDDFIGWTDVAGQYVQGRHELPDGRTIDVFRLVNRPADRRFLLTNRDDYSLTYDGMVLAVEKRRSSGWQLFGSYTFSKAYGLQASSGANAAGAQVSTVSPPNAIVFGRDPNDLTHARGRLPNDRPHVFRLMGTVDVPRTGLVLAANLQHFSGKPWAATTQALLPQGDVRIFLEARGARRLPSQSLLDLRLSRMLPLGDLGRLEFLVDILNVLNDEADESLATDNLFSPNFGRGVAFVDPRRAMLGVRLSLGR